MCGRHSNYSSENETVHGYCQCGDEAYSSISGYSLTLVGSSFCTAPLIHMDTVSALGGIEAAAQHQPDRLPE